MQLSMVEISGTDFWWSILLGYVVISIARAIVGYILQIGSSNINFDRKFCTKLPDFIYGNLTGAIASDIRLRYAKFCKSRFNVEYIVV